jgi:hypothetical protein
MFKTTSGSVESLLSSGSKTHEEEVVEWGRTLCPQSPLSMLGLLSSTGDSKFLFIIIYYTDKQIIYVYKIYTYDTWQE